MSSWYRVVPNGVDDVRWCELVRRCAELCPMVRCDGRFMVWYMAVCICADCCKMDPVGAEDCVMVCDDPGWCKVMRMNSELCIGV